VTDDQTKQAPQVDLAGIVEPVHPRDRAIESAAEKLLKFLNPWIQEHNLTVVEYQFILTTVLGRQLQRLCIAEREKKS